MSKSTLEQAFVDILKSEMDDNKKPYSVEEALERALEDTTPEYGGVPWKIKRENDTPQSEWFDNE